ncbi:MAG: purine-binding chemotaxis protein CheW [Chitinispirillaceae bacterium]|nr:purine-binding chemotaxis protein CheW [Chitinispirillaceae bacterium]
METITAIKESGQYLTFQLGDELFAFDVLRTNEVLEVTQVTRIPGANDAMIGVINLRGSVVPVIDLRKRLNMPQKERTVDTSIIIIDTDYGDEKITLGVLVDAAKQVIMLDKTQLEPPPKVGMKMNIEYITAIGKHDNNFIILLNSDRIFSEKELIAAVEVRDVQE